MTTVVIIVVELVFINCSFVLLYDYQKLFTKVIQVRQQTKILYKCSLPLHLFQHLDVNINKTSASQRPSFRNNREQTTNNRSPGFGAKIRKWRCQGNAKYKIIK